MPESKTTQEGGNHFRVVYNAEQQFSIWPKDLEVPNGWEATDTVASKEECLKYIEETWTDMRPLSIRNREQRASEER